MNSKEKLDSYVRIKSPDKDALAELVIRAKGPSRSLRQFADELGVNVSTLSRIVNKKTASANSDALIADIADHADENSGVTLEMLLTAHGMAPKSQVGGNEMFAYGEAAQATLIKELVLRKYTVNSNTQWKRGVALDSIMGRCYLDFELHTNALGKEDSVWLFDFQAPGKGGVRSIDQQLNRIRQWMLMYAGMLCFNEGKVDRLSLVISERNVYDRMLEVLKGYKTRYGLSLILIDLERSIVVEEFVVGEENGSHPVFYPITEDEDFVGGEIDDFENAVVFGDDFVFELHDNGKSKEDTE